MVAYSFKQQFVTPIQLGLSVDYSRGGVMPKRQTIRARGLRRHARPGDELQLYRGMRTKTCFLIGRARCLDASDITIQFGADHDVVDIKGERPPIPRQTSDIANLDRFAAADGFKSWDALLKFWDEEHDGIVTKCGRFDGLLIRWEPLS